MRQQQQQYEQQQQRRLAEVKERDTTSPSLSPVIPKRSTIVTKSGLNRMFNIQV
ncbi:hypothetical protein DPMN_096576 [Dreissena polymorpha]|uniref:Uncharacterized protein n=2 Tax=Dreissena polymorpha TaxID=45954 RepID=A0A9D4LBC0_DREPO|nr:hypothetical protein DPMN_096576 [Dreissena polymorpha]